MRIQAVQGIIQMVSMGVTAASTLTFALQSLGYTRFAPVVLGIGLVGTPAFAWAYTELGVFNRKNRERMDRGDNFAGPGMYMNHIAQARYIAAAIAHADDPETAMNASERVARDTIRDFRDGVDLDVFYGGEPDRRADTRREVEA
jgi:hypothetical protein